MDGSEVRGEFYTTHVDLGGLTAEYVPVLMVIDSNMDKSEYDGICGMAPNSFFNESVNSLVYILKEQGLIPKAMFSTMYTLGASYIDFGSYDTHMLVSNWTDIEETGYWEVNAKEIWVNDTKIGILDTVVIDTGTSYLLFTNDVYDPLMKSFKNCSLS